MRKNGRASEDFVIGKVYYQVGVVPVVEGGDPTLLVSAWRYDGIEKLSCNARTCDLPYHFLRFTQVTGYDDARDPSAPRKYIPSKAQARMSMLEWSEFREYVIEAGDDGRGVE
jgi:hypothetical protein